MYNPIIRGWLEYYGRYCPSELYKFCRHFNKTLVAWAMRKYKKFEKRKRKAGKFLEAAAKSNPKLFAHWEKGMLGAFA